MYSVLLFWHLAFRPFLIINPCSYLRSLSRSLIYFLQNSFIFILCWIICFLRQAFISSCPCHSSQPTPQSHIQDLVGSLVLPCLSCNLAVKQVALTTNVSMWNSSIYIASTLSHPDWGLSTHIFLEFFFSSMMSGKYREWEGDEERWELVIVIIWEIQDLPKTAHLFLFLKHSQGFLNSTALIYGNDERQLRSYQVLSKVTNK